MTDRRVQLFLRLTVAIWCVDLFGLSVLAAAPKLNYLFPAGGQRGTTFVVQCHGDFEWPVEVWSPGASVKSLEEKGELEVSVSADLPADRIWFRLFDTEGVSNALPLLIGSLSEATENEPNDSTTEAQKIEPIDGQTAATINGRLGKTDDVDCFSVGLEKGETLIAALAANSRFGSPMDAILQVVTPTGTILADNHDAVGLDPRIAFNAPVDGTYIVRLFAFAATPNTNIRYHGGDNYVYRLTMTTGPFMTHALPLCVSDESNDDNLLTPVGWNIPEDAQLQAALFGGDHLAGRPEIENADSRVALGTRLGFVFDSRFAGSARVRFAAQEMLGSTPSRRVESPRDRVVIPPCREIPFSTTGLIGNPNQFDEYSFAVQQDDQFVIAVESLSLELPLVPVVQLLDPMNNIAAENQDASDVLIQHQAKRSGTYKLSITDRYRRGGERFYYRLTVRELSTHFQLTAETDSLVINPDKPTEFAVLIKRTHGKEGKIGPITIEAIDLPPGITCKSVISDPDGDSSKKVTLSFESDGKSYSGVIRIKGTVDRPQTMDQFCLTPEKYGARTNVFWVTATATATE